MAQIKFSVKGELLWVKVKCGDRIVKYDDLVSWNVLEEDKCVVFFNSKREAVISIPLSSLVRAVLKA